MEIPGSIALDNVLQTAIAAIETEGGRITHAEGAYLAAEFSSPAFGFVDDLEIRIDQASGRLHFRSASRVGYGDGGANRRRVDRLRAELQTRLAR